ncbi:Cof-type HAD-IIB family hydrolase [Metabacillus fastidiosus]|uniref:Cof-type HAD-IIB family hydrolase n=1 Tax=Metabacillus fastidiosus TaxID=1458 RepID=A0ABU6NTD8_9BACI|nr:Cof-type HAD-IIB family hydrolase [Metabacillus fastidiosus]MED4400418.1 Cof-type HAD-IIB family hydrolase [Metabacillus fastidiosus]MED4454135.1 Cof-type HAD-IIB family hydrolase [Metabacillus fastidiosus]MED4464302.1 Cof-type HAD-IIB family hydrolase [Metabacillus fastidiosus]
MRKLIAIDLDGTLLSSHYQISKENIQAIRHAQKAGHIVIICSGRAPEDIAALSAKFDLDCPIAGSNGTVVIINGKEISNISMDKKTVFSASKLLDQFKSPYRVYTNYGVFIEAAWAERFSEIFQQYKEIKDTVSIFEYKMLTEEPIETDTLKIFHQIDDLLSLKNIKVQKFFIPTLIQSTKEELISAFQKMEEVALTSSGPTNIEIMDKNGNKSNGIKTLAKYFGIPLENTIAIGDNFNDLPMMEAAGLSVAMGNGDPKVKELCDIITLTNDEHGVAYAIEKYVLNL